MARPIVLTACTIGSSESWRPNSTHIHGFHVPVAESPAEDERDPSLLVCAHAGCGAVFEHSNYHGGDQQHEPEQCKAVSVAHDRRLGADCVTDGDDGAVHCARGIGEAV